MTGVAELMGAVVEDNGADNVFLTLEKMEDTSAYDDWSFSSSSENGLNEVRLVISSSLLLLRDLEEEPLPRLGLEDISVSMSVGGGFVRFVQDMEEIEEGTIMLAGRYG